MTSSAIPIGDSERIRLESNLQLYPWYQAAASFIPWMPIFFLYFIQLVPLEQVVRLSAIYYLAVVFSEVPSGYLSDRFGRRLTLLFSATSLLVAYLVFIAATGFYSLLVAEIFLAMGIAFQSGSDTSLLYDSLRRLGRQDEYAAREARATQFSMGASAVACLAGGFSGVINLTFPYVLSALGALVTIALCYRLYEPSIESERSHQGFILQVRSCMRYFMIPLLLWLLSFYIIGYGLQHVLYEFYQPYIQLLDIDLFARDEIASAAGADHAPAVSGVIFGLSMFVGVFGAHFGLSWFRKLGLSRLLLVAIAFQSTAIGVMSIVLHPLVLLLVISRNFSMAMVQGPVMGAIGPLVESNERATYLSLRSLLARLGFSLWLFLLSLMLTPGELLDWVSLSSLLFVCALFGLVCLAVLALSSSRVKGLH